MGPNQQGDETMSRLFERIYCLGVPFHNVSNEETREAILQRMKAGTPGMAVITPNLDFMRVMESDARLRRAVMEGDLVIADGMPAIVWLKAQGFPLKGRVTGSDLTRDLFGICADNGFSIYVLGAAPSAVETALAKMKAAHPSLKVAGAYSPPMMPLEQMNLDDIAARIAAAKPDLVFVAMGMGKQEAAIYALRRRVDVPVWLAIGGSIDFIAGVQRRAPAAVQKIGLEWFWRMAMQPRRMFGRYFRDGVWLLRRIARQIGLWLACRFAPKPCACPAESAPKTIRLPSLATPDQQEAFMALVRKGTFTHLDLSGHASLNPLELAMVVLVDAMCLRGTIPLIRLSGVSPTLRRQLRIEHLFRTDPLLQSRENAMLERPWSLFAPAHLFAAAGIFLGYAIRPDGAGLAVGFCIAVGASLIPRIIRSAWDNPAEAFDHLDHDVLLICQKGLITSASANTAKLLGCADYELIDHRLSELFPEIDTADATPRVCDTVLVGRYKKILPVRVRFLPATGQGLQSVVVSSQHSEYARAREMAHFEDRRRLVIDHLCRTLETDAVKEGNQVAACFGTVLIRSSPIRGDFACRAFSSTTHIGLIIGDVSGCGDDAVVLGNALKNEVYRTISELMMASLTHDRPDVTSIISTLDVAVTRYLMDMGALFSFGAVLFNRLNGRLDYVSCGIPCLIHAHAATGQASRLPVENIPLGILPRQPLKVETLTLAPGDAVLFATDGLLSWHERSRTGLSLETLFARAAKSRNAASMINDFHAFYKAGSDPAVPLPDDIAMATIVREPAGPCQA